MAGNHLKAVTAEKLPWLDEALRHVLECCANGEGDMLVVSYTSIPQGGPGVECLDATHGGVRRCSITSVHVTVELPEGIAATDEESMPQQVVFYAG